VDDGHRRRWQTGHDGPGRDNLNIAHMLGSALRRLGNRARNVREERSAAIRAIAIIVEPADYASPEKAKDFKRQVTRG